MSPTNNFGPCIRLSIRVDLYTVRDRCDYSVIAWRHPQAAVIVNEVVEDIGPLYRGAVVSDVAQCLAVLIDHAADDTADDERPASSSLVAGLRRLGYLGP